MKLPQAAVVNIQSNEAERQISQVITSVMAALVAEEASFAIDVASGADKIASFSVNE